MEPEGPSEPSIMNAFMTQLTKMRQHVPSSQVEHMAAEMGLGDVGDMRWEKLPILVLTKRDTYHFACRCLPDWQERQAYYYGHDGDEVTDSKLTVLHKRRFNPDSSVYCWIGQCQFCRTLWWYDCGA